MALPTPSVKQIADQIVADIASKTNQTVPLLSKAVWRVLGYALAGVWIILYKYGTWAFNQIFPQLAGEAYLELLGTNKGVIRTAAVAWEGTVTLDVLINSSLPAGTQLIYNATGVIYLTTTTVNLTTPSQTIDIKAVTAGDIGDLQNGVVINFVNPFPNVGRIATVASTTVNGANEEDLEVFRQRVIDAYQKQPQGGALADYEQWSNETPNVINSYPYAGSAPPDVDVYIEVDDQPDGIPTIAQKAAALNYIICNPITGIQDRKPITDDCTVLGISRTDFDVEITGLSPDTPETRAAIQTGVEEYFTEKEPFILGLTIVRFDKITISGVMAAAENIASLNGATFTTLALEESGSPVITYTLGTGEKAKANVITWL